MLTTLAIRDIVLIERLDLEFAGGLCVLTGETGAGKSILLDAVGLALGGRSDRALVRQGAAQGSVTAVFTDLGDGGVQRLLAEHGIAA
jgi:DNA repair protein RecN (Recombination protein N)